MTDTINPETQRWAARCEECDSYAVFDTRPTDAQLHHGCAKPAERVVEELEILTPAEMAEMLGCGRCSEIEGLKRDLAFVGQQITDANAGRITNAEAVNIITHYPGADKWTSLPETVTDQVIGGRNGLV